jgi:hypothetical protein
MFCVPAMIIGINRSMDVDWAIIDRDESQPPSSPITHHLIHVSSGIRSVKERFRREQGV